MMTAAALLALAAGCAQQEKAPAVDLAVEEKAIWAHSAEWMKLAQAKDTAAIVDTVFLPDAITNFDGTVRRGAAEIKAGLDAIYLSDDTNPEENLLDRERRILGVDHTELGAIYLSQHQLPTVLVEVTRHHHQPERSQKARELTAAVHIADMLARYAHIGTSGNKLPVDEESWLQSKAWQILYPNTSKTDQQIAHASLKRTLERLPHILEGLV